MSADRMTLQPEAPPETETQLGFVLPVVSEINQHPPTWFPSPLASQQGQLDVVHACSLSGPPGFCVVSASVGALNAPYSSASTGVHVWPPPPPPPPSLFKVRELKARTPSAPFLCAERPFKPSHLCFLSTSSSSLSHSRSPSFFILSCLYISPSLPLSPPTER